MYGTFAPMTGWHGHAHRHRIGYILSEYSVLYGRVKRIKRDRLNFIIRVKEVEALFRGQPILKLKEFCSK